MVFSQPSRVSQVPQVPRAIAVIPLRGGSKSIPRKNLRLIGGKPLFYWATSAALDSGVFAAVIVSTEDAEIAAAVRQYFPTVRVLERPLELASDTASSESVLLHVAAELDSAAAVTGSLAQRETGAAAFDTMALVQATSPLVVAEDFRRAWDLFQREGYDALLTGVPFHRFLWQADERGRASPVNYDPLARPRRQDFKGALMENGAFYFTRRSVLLESRNRLGGESVGFYVMAPETGVELDDEADWAVVENLLNRQLRQRASTLASASLVDRLRQIRLVVLDVDGTLTDGGMYFGPDGEALKKFDTRDGHGLWLLRQSGCAVAVITRESSAAVRARMKKLEIEHFYEGIKEKEPVLRKLMDQLALAQTQVAYVGDDEPDFGCFPLVGLSACPADAPAATHSRVDYVLRRSAGAGAVREFCDLMLANRDGGSCQGKEHPPS